MKNKLKDIIKPTIIAIIVAFLLAILIVFGIRFFLGQQIEEVLTIVSYVTVDSESSEETLVFDTEIGLKNYPEYGTKYANIKIDSIGVDLPVYYGDTMEVLKKGVGHSSGSYFPGEGGSIIYLGHNSKSIFRNFSELEKGDIIEVTTDYGEFSYEIYDMKIIEETDIDALPIQRDEEILMVYTCYPFNNIGYTTKRYVVYSKLIENE